MGATSRGNVYNILNSDQETKFLNIWAVSVIDPTTVFLYGVFPYIALFMFVGGTLYRFWGWLSAGGLTGLYSAAVMGYSGGSAIGSARG